LRCQGLAQHPAPQPQSGILPLPVFVVKDFNAGGIAKQLETCSIAPNAADLAAIPGTAGPQNTRRVE
jgi:hypothetical protein